MTDMQKLFAEKIIMDRCMDASTKVVLEVAKGTVDSHRLFPFVFFFPMSSFLSPPAIHEAQTQSSLRATALAIAGHHLSEVMGPSTPRQQVQDE